MPVGIFLSAGIDSSLVARAAARAGTVARAFSLGFTEQSHNEVPGARQTAAQLGIPITEVTLTASALERFVDLVAHADDPLADSSALAVWTLAAETAKHVKVVLSGDGGDELFGGYLTYPATLWHASVTSRLPGLVKRAMAAASECDPRRQRQGDGVLQVDALPARGAACRRARRISAGTARGCPKQAAALVHEGPARTRRSTRSRSWPSAITCAAASRSGTCSAPTLPTIWSTTSW